MAYAAYQFRLYPNATQETDLRNQLETLRQVYNAALGWWKDAYAYEKAGRGDIIPRVPKKSGTGKRKHGLTETLYPLIAGLRNDHLARQKAGETGPHWLAQVSSTAIRDTIGRVEKAFKNFYERVKKGAKKVGYPRFKAYGRLTSIPFENYNGCVLRDPTGRRVVGDSGESLRGFRLDLFGVGRIGVNLHRPIVGKIKTVNVKRDADDKWYVTFICEQPETVVEPKTGPAVGIDVGLEHFLTTSDGEHEPNPRFLASSLKKLRKEQRSASRKIESAKKTKRKFRECKNLQKAFRVVARTHVRVRNQRKEGHHQVSNRLVERYATVCVESLNVRGMLRNGKLARAIADAGWSGFVGTLKLKAAKAGVRVVEVDPYGTSQECPECGAVVKKKLSERTHRCPCGYETHRDHAAARVILARGIQGAVPAPSQPNAAPLPAEQSAGKGKRAGRSPSTQRPAGLPSAASGRGSSGRKRSRKHPPLAGPTPSDDENGS